MPKIEQVDTKSLPIFQCDEIDENLPYFEVICEYGIFREQTLTQACHYWCCYRQAEDKIPASKFNILTISSIVIVDGEETSFSIN